MQSLTDRMATALRSLRDSWDYPVENFNLPEACARDSFDEINRLLAEYEAERNPKLAARPRAQVGQRIRVVSAHLNGECYQNGDDGVVVAVMQTPFEEGVRVDFGSHRGPWLLYHSEYEIIPNLPATNTGD